MPTYSGPHRVPVGTDPNNIPGDIVAALESVIPALTTAQIDALDWSRKPAGRFVAYDTTKQRLVVSTGAAMVDLIDARGGTMAGAIAMGGRKVTGLAAASANGDAVRFEQPLMKTGGYMTGAIGMGVNKITSLADGTASGDAVNVSQLNAVKATADAALPKSGGTVTGDLYAGGALYVGGLESYTSGAVAYLRAAGHSVRLSAGATELRLNYSATPGEIATNRDTASGDSARALVTKGYVDAIGSRIVAGVLTATTDGGGCLTLTLPSLPSGASGWSLVASMQSIAGGAATCDVSVASLTGTIRCYQNDVLLDLQPVTIHWQAIAY